MQGGQWRRALVAYDEMAAGNCRPDSGVYNAVVGTLWSTGILAAQAKAVTVFKTAVHAGHFRLSVHTSPDASARLLKRRVWMDVCAPDQWARMVSFASFGAGSCTSSGQQSSNDWLLRCHRITSCWTLRTAFSINLPSGLSRGSAPTCTSSNAAVRKISIPK